FERPHVAAARPRVLEQPLNALEVSARDDPGTAVGPAIAGHRLARVAGRETREILQLPTGHETVVDGDAHLAVLYRLGAEQLLDRLAIDAVLGENRGALATELERYRYELLGRRLRDLAPDRRAARVQKVIPANASESPCQLETADDHIDL